MQTIDKRKFLIKLSRPSASDSPWFSALPSGNGRTGILVQGGVRYERIMITSCDSLWQGQVGVLPDISDKIKDVRKNMSSKNPTHAATIMNTALQKKGYEPTAPALLPICDLNIKHNVGTKPISSYVRELNMENGQIKVSFNDSGTRCERSAFVSKTSNNIVYQISKTAGVRPLSVELSLCEHDKNTSCFEEVISEPFKFSSNEYQTDFMTFSFSTNTITAGAVARVVADTGAIISLTKNSLKVENAEKIVVIISTFVGNKEKLIPQIKESLLKLKNISYEKMLSDHSKLFAKVWNKVSLSISDEKEVFVDNLLKDFSEVKSKILYEKLFHYARFLTICGLENEYATLCPSALWSFHYKNTKSVAKIASSVPTFVYLALKLGLESQLGFLFDYFEAQASDFRKNAVRLYKSRGFMIPNKLAYKTGLPSSIEPFDLSFVAGGAIVANLFYDYFEYTRDIKFLKNRAIPFMLEVATFYMSYLQVDGNGALRSCPSYSPNGVNKAFEHRPLGIYENATCDFVTIRTLISNIIKSSKLFNIDIPDINAYHTFLSALPTLKIDKGAIAEYIGSENSLMSSGTLHLYPVFASNEVDITSSKPLISAFLSVVLSKITSGLFYQNAASLGRLAEVAALLGQGEASLEIINYLITSFLRENLIFNNFDFTNLGASASGDAYFNINVNQLVATSIASMLVSSNNNTIFILPALPSGWDRGQIEGVATRCGAVVSLYWNLKKGTLDIKIKANKNTVFNIALPHSTKRVKDFEFDPQTFTIENVSILGGKIATFEIKL